MNPTSGVQDKAFALLCCQGNTRGSGDKSLERAFQSLSLKHHVETVHAAVEGSQTAFLPGAGAVYMNACEYAMVENRWMAIFVGQIENYAYCVKKYCLTEAGLDVGSTYLLETVRALSPLNNAEVVALLFKKLGPTFMSKLRGSFSFVVYDSQVGYVLATNDCNGTHKLWQAHIASDNSLLIACNCEVAIAHIERTPIAAGEYKFGWRSMPIPYMASSETVMSKCSEARQAALEALASASVPVEKLAAPSASRSVPRVTTRRHTFTVPRSRPSLSGVYSHIASTSDGAWHPVGSPVAASPPTRPGSYVPPHRRSMSSAQPCSVPAAVGVARPPPSMPRNMPVARSVDRRTSLSDRARSWRRAESEDLPRFTPQADACVPMLAPAAEEVQGDYTSAHLAHALLSMNSPEQSQGDDEEEALRAAPYYQMATASKLFQPAPVEREKPDAEVTEDVTCSLSDDEFVWPSQRSHPIPIRVSRDSRPSLDATANVGAMAPANPEVQPLVEKNNVNSSVESLVSSGTDESDTAAEGVQNMERPSSLMFPWSETGSSAPGSVAGLQGQLSATANEVNGCFARKDSSSPSLRQETFRSARTCKKATEAKQLLDKVAQSINPVMVTVPITEVDADLSDFPDIGELSFPRLHRQEVHSNTPTMANLSLGKPLVNLEPSVEEEPGESSSSGTVDTPLDASTSKASAPAHPQMNGGMKASGSFSDALQLLLQSRPASTPPAKVKPAFPRPRSGLMHVVPTGAIMPDPSSENMDMLDAASVRPEKSSRVDEAPDSGAEDDRGSGKTGPALKAAVPSCSSVPKDLHPLPAALLASLTGGDDGDTHEKAALASLLYSSPCALCILDAKAEGQPVVYVNSKFSDETGYAFDDAVGQPCRFLQAAPGARRHPSLASIALDRALSRGRNYTGRILNFGKSGIPFWNQLSIVPIRSKADLEVTHFVALSTFTAADPQVEESPSIAPLVARGSSHQCLMSLEQESSVRLVPQRSSSYMVLSSIASGDTGTLELVSN